MPSSAPIIQGTLKLSPERLTLVKRRILERFNETREESGWQSRPSIGSGLSYADGSFLHKRLIYSRHYEGDFSDRAAKDKLFANYNTSWNLPQRAVRVFKAKANEKLLNTDPFMTLAQSRRIAEDPRLKLADEYLHHLVTDANGKYVMQTAIEGAGVRGETILKPTRRVDEVHRQQDVRIAMIGGQVLKDSDGRDVTEKDEWEADPEAIDPAQVRLRRDPNIKIIGEPEYSAPKKMPVSRATRSGLDISIVPWQDWFCPTTATDIHKADAVFQVFDLDVDDLLSRMAGMKLSDEAEAWLRDVRLSDAAAKQDSATAVIDRGEDEIAKEYPRKTSCFEGWLRLDADDDERAEELNVVMDIEREQIIYIDYMEEASPTGKRPFESVVLIPTFDRWHGVGFYRLLESQHLFADRQRNRLDARNSSSARIMMGRQNAFVGDPVVIEWNTGKIYWVREGIQMEEALHVQDMPPLEEDIWPMLEKEIQNATLISGTMTPTEGEFSNLPANDTLGGMEMAAKESETLNDDALQWVIKGLVATLGQSAVIALGRDGYDPEKARDILGDEDAAQLTAWVEEGESRNLLQRVKLLLTKTRTRQQLEANKQVIEVIQPRWESLPAEQKIRWYDVYVAILNSLEVPDPEKKLGELADIQAQALAEQQMAQQQAAPNVQPGAQPGQPAAPKPSGMER